MKYTSIQLVPVLITSSEEYSAMLKYLNTALGDVNFDADRGIISEDGRKFHTDRIRYLIKFYTGQYPEFAVGSDVDAE